MDLAIKLIVFLPLVAAAIAGLFCRVIGARPAQIVTCAAIDWRRTFALCCSVSTMAPIIATSSTRPATSKKKTYFV